MAINGLGCGIDRSAGGQQGLVGGGACLAGGKEEGAAQGLFLVAGGGGPEQFCQSGQFGQVCGIGTPLPVAEQLRVDGGVEGLAIIGVHVAAVGLRRHLHNPAPQLRDRQHSFLRHLPDSSMQSCRPPVMPSRQRGDSYSVLQASILFTTFFEIDVRRDIVVLKGASEWT